MAKVLRIEYSARDGKWLWVWLVNDRIYLSGFANTLKEAFDIAYPKEPSKLEIDHGPLSYPPNLAGR